MDWAKNLVSPNDFRIFASSFEVNDRTYKDVELNVLSAARRISQIQIASTVMQSLASIVALIHFVYTLAWASALLIFWQMAMREPYARDK